MLMFSGFTIYPGLKLYTLMWETPFSLPHGSILIELLLCREKTASLSLRVSVLLFFFY